MTDKITNHTFIRSNDGRCGYTYGSGADRERCGNAEVRHAASSNLASGIDRRPHSRACGLAQHAHGTACSSNCPTCGGKTTPEPKPFTEESPAAQPDASENLKDDLLPHESTKRVLYHLVHSYQTWRDPGSGLGVPNEFTDDAVRIGEQHLREVDWFPEDEGWLANHTDTSPDDHSWVSDNVLALIDGELSRLRAPVKSEVSLLWGRRKKGWIQGVGDARAVAAKELQHIRDAYVIESLTRETEALRLYGIQENQDG